MLKVAKLADYALLILHFLAGDPAAPRSVERISQATLVPVPTVRKVMKLLGEAGLVRAKRGPGGGYQIGRDPGAISLADTITAIEGPVSLTECCTDDCRCEIAPACDLRGDWPDINQIVLGVLGDISLTDLRRQRAARAAVAAAPVQVAPSTG